VTAPERATKGANAAPAVEALAGGPTLANAAPGTVFPLKQSVMIGDSLAGVSPDKASNAAGATLTILGDGGVRLTVPGLAVDEYYPVPYGYGGTGTCCMIVLGRDWQNLDYLRVNTWVVEYENRPAASFAWYMLGYETPASAVPNSGAATYSGPVSGAVSLANKQGGALGGDASVNVNFSTATVTGTLTNMLVNPVTQREPWNDVSLQASLASNSFSGTAAVTSAPGTPRALGAGATGTVEGGLYGPAANQLGAVWTLYDGQNAAIGVIGASRQ
jgi:hypothetical protein